MYYGLINSMNKSAGYTARTTAFASATGITDVTILGALNTFDLALISNSLDSKISLLYPFVGGDSSKHSYNFMNPSLFQITWNGGVTHNANGITGNGVNGYGATGFVPSANLSLNSVHISTYIRTNVNENKCDFGSASAGNNNGLGIYSRYSNLLITSTNDGDTLNSAIADSRGLTVGNRSGATARKQFKNGVQVATSSTASSALNAYGLYILCQNASGSVDFAYSSKNISFASVGSSLSDAEQATFYTLVQNLQTTLSRQI